MARTLGQIATMIRRRLGWPSADSFVSNDELFDMIRESQRELFDFMVSIHNGMYRLGKLDVVVAANQTDVAFQNSPDGTLGDVIGTPIARLIRVAAKFGNKSIRARPMPIETDQLDYTPVPWNESTDIQYHFTTGGLALGEVFDRVLRVHPVPATTCTLELAFNQGPTTLSLTDAIQDLENDEYIILDGMIKCLQAEETDPAVVMAQKERLIQRLTNEATPLDIGRPPTIADVRGADIGPSTRWWW